MAMAFAERMSPRDLSERIKIIAEEEAVRLGSTVDANALNKLSTIPIEYSSQDTIEIDVPRLHDTINEIVRRAAQSTSNQIRDVINLQQVDDALKNAPCHYLWFC